METSKIPKMAEDIPENAVSIYGQNEAADEFPVLKAFQQYIDAEQEKARKRVLMLGAFFGFVLIVVITVFVVFLLNLSSRNQALNDRLVEYAMKDRDRSSSPVVVQPPQDTSAILAIKGEIEALQKKLSDKDIQERAAVEEAKKEAEAAKAKLRSEQDREIARLKTLLSAEREKASVEAKRKRQAEIEAYRRKHYPELYESEDELLPRPRRTTRSVGQKRLQREAEEAEAEIESILNDTEAISYFNDEEDSPSPRRKPAKAKVSVKTEDNYSIPVDVKGSSSSWSIPLD